MAIIENEETPENPVGMAAEVQEEVLPEDMISEENEDGSISFFVEEEPKEEDVPFDANLAEFIDETFEQYGYTVPLNMLAVEWGLAIALLLTISIDLVLFGCVKCAGLINRKKKTS